MRRLLLILTLISAELSQAQDSLQAEIFRPYDCTLFMAFDFIENERKVNPTYIRSFTRDSRHSFDHKEFPDTSSYDLYDNAGGETDGGEFGFLMTFRFNKPGKIRSRLKPRIGVFYNYKQFFSYELNLSKTTPLTTIAGNRQFDSVAVRNITYSYYSEQICAQLGFNYDLLQRRSITLYTGLIYSQGLSYKNEFTTKTEDSYRIDSRSKDGAESKGTSHILRTRSYNSNEPFSSSVRLSVPFGLQQRFSHTKQFSIGFMFEGRLGYEKYVIERGRSVTFGYFAVSAGLRFSLDSHL